MKPSTPSLQHALALLEALRQSPDGLNAQALQERLGGLPRSTFFALVNALKALGYVEQSGRRGVYLAGAKLLAWTGSAALAGRELLAAFQQEAAALALQETLALALPRPQGALIAEQSAPQQRVRVVYEIGQVLPPAACAAAGLFAASAGSETRRRGYHLLLQAEAVELALPVCRDGRTPCAALLLGAPRARQSAQSLLEVLPALREAAARLSYRLGAPFYAPFQDENRPPVQPQSSLSGEELNRFLQSPLVARLACLRPDGAPHVVPVWQAWDGQNFYVAAWEGSLWARYLAANPSVSLTVDEPWLPLRRVTAQGMAHPLAESDYPGGTAALVAHLRRRYLGEAAARPARRGWQAFRITPQTLRGWQGLVVG